MEIKSLKLQNWRSHNTLNFDFNEITIIIGVNASGKTNFLEAIYYLATAKSFRSKDMNLIGWEQNFTRIEAVINKGNDKEDITVVLEKLPNFRKTVKLKEQKVSSSKILGHLNCVIFTPEEIELIYTLPDARRRYINLILSQTNVKYAYNLLHYKKVVEQRNNLLKRLSKGTGSIGELELWDGKLAEYATPIIEERLDYLRQINDKISDYYKKLSNQKASLEIKYKPSVEPDKGWAGIIEGLLKNRERDTVVGSTSIGPHRDDLGFIMNGRDIVDFASRGEFRTVMLALKLSEIDYFYQKTGEKPVLLLDDVFSELDECRRDLLSQIFLNQQTIVTTTDLDHVSKNILEKAKVINLGQTCG
ncbi:MAG: DNA replication/repair protein RecF [bacterium]